MTAWCHPEQQYRYLARRFLVSHGHKGQAWLAMPWSQTAWDSMIGTPLPPLHVPRLMDLARAHPQQVAVHRCCKETMEHISMSVAGSF